MNNLLKIFITLYLSFLGSTYLYAKQIPNAHSSNIPQPSHIDVNEIEVVNQFDNEIPDLVMGAATAKVTLIEYSSINCAGCASFHMTQFPQLKKQWIDKGKVKFIYRHFPLDKQAVVAMALIAQFPPNQWFNKINEAYSKMDKWHDKGLYTLGEILGMDKQKCDAILAQKNLLDRIIAKRNNAEKKYKVPVTPTFVIIKNGYEEELGQEVDFVALEKKLKEYCK